MMYQNFFNHLIKEKGFYSGASFFAGALVSLFIFSLIMLFVTMLKLAFGLNLGYVLNKGAATLTGIAIMLIGHWLQFKVFRFKKHGDRADSKFNIPNNTALCFFLLICPIILALVLFLSNDLNK